MRSKIIFYLHSLNLVSEWDKSQNVQPWRGQLCLPPGRLGALANLQHQDLQDPVGEVELSGRETRHILLRTGADSSFFRQLLSLASPGAL